MARAKSVVLTPAEKKATIVTLKASIKSAKDNVKNIAGIRKESDKVFAAANKTHLANLKANDKEAAAATKTLTGLEAQLKSLSAPAVAVAA
jgi:hypothetical protein